jgi:hypothetical protein
MSHRANEKTPEKRSRNSTVRRARPGATRRRACRFAHIYSRACAAHVFACAARARALTRARRGDIARGFEVRALRQAGPRRHDRALRQAGPRRHARDANADGADVGRFVAQMPVGSFRIGASATLDDDDAMEEDDATVEDEPEVVLDHSPASVDEQEAQARAEDEPRVHAANGSLRIGASATLDDDDASEDDEEAPEASQDVVRAGSSGDALGDGAGRRRRQVAPDVRWLSIYFHFYIRVYVFGDFSSKPSRRRTAIRADF